MYPLKTTSSEIAVTINVIAVVIVGNKNNFFPSITLLNKIMKIMSIVAPKIP